MNGSLLAALINSIAIPELTIWLRNLHGTNGTVTDADVIAKLAADAQMGEETGLAWLAAHPDE